MYPKEYILSTDYATLKNDTQSNVVSLTIPSGLVYNPSNPVLASTVIKVGTVNAGLRSRMMTTKFGSWVVGQSMMSTSMMSIPSIPSVPPFEQWLLVTLERISDTDLLFSVSTEGASGSPNYIVNETQTISCVFSTFLSPFN